MINKYVFFLIITAFFSLLSNVNAAVLDLTQDSEKIVFLSYTQEELDKNYTQTSWALNSKQIIDRMKKRSTEFRDEVKTFSELSYGKSSIERFAFFKAKRKNAPLVIFIHGGAWKSGKAEDYSYVAKPFIDNNINVAILDFDSVEKNGLEGMMSQIITATKWIYNNSNKLKINKEKIYVVGHSSGAHLGGVLLTTDWEKIGLPNNIIKGATLISGMYDMYPVRLSLRSKYLYLNDNIEENMSPIRHQIKSSPQIIISFGSLESDEFKRQSLDFYNYLKKQNIATELIVQQYFNHFEIMDDFGNPYNQATKKMITNIKTSK